MKLAILCFFCFPGMLSIASHAQPVCNQKKLPTSVTVSKWRTWKVKQVDQKRGTLELIRFEWYCVGKKQEKQVYITWLKDGLPHQELFVE